MQIKAIAAMSLNRAIGYQGRIPWYLPEDFKWFKKITMGNILLMGRKTFESIGKPRPGRTTYVLTRKEMDIPQVTTIHNLTKINKLLSSSDPRSLFICGGAEIYNQLLPLCEEVYLTLVNKIVEADAFMPPFEHLFSKREQIMETSDFKIFLYSNN